MKTRKEIKQALKVLRRFLESDQAHIADLRLAIEPQGWTLSSAAQVTALLWVLGKPVPAHLIDFGEKVGNLEKMMTELDKAAAVEKAAEPGEGVL